MELRPKPYQNHVSPNTIKLSYISVSCQYIYIYIYNQPSTQVPYEDHTKVINSSHTTDHAYILIYFIL